MDLPNIKYTLMINQVFLAYLFEFWNYCGIILDYETP